METHNHETHQPAEQHHRGMSHNKFVIMILLSFVAMYILMYAMVDRFENALPNVNQLYMAGLMTSGMVIIELLLMGKMYANKKLNRLFLIIGVVALVLFYTGIRKQTAVGDKQFLKSMIPHHAAAVLMVKETTLRDPELRKLAKDIIEAQEKEIAFMKTKLEEMDK
jgi:hypothetical protein